MGGAKDTNLAGVLKAFAFEHDCELSTPQGEELASLIDISGSGARLKLHRGEADVRLGEGTPVRLNIRLPDLGVETGNLPCRVRWTNGPELGVAFDRSLGVGVSDLQSMLDK
jgi:hypothetical protein